MPLHSSGSSTYYAFIKLMIYKIAGGYCHHSHLKQNLPYGFICMSMRKSNWFVLHQIKCIVLVFVPFLNLLTHLRCNLLFKILKSKLKKILELAHPLILCNIFHKTISIQNIFKIYLLLSKK